MVGDPSIFSAIAERIRLRRELMRIDRRLKRPLLALQSDLTAYGYTFKLNSGYRNAAYQRDLIRRWENGDPTVITEPAPPGESAHQYGLAVDLEINPPDYDVLGQVAEDNGLVQPDPEDDPVHVELPNWRTLTRGWSERRLVPV